MRLLGIVILDMLEIIIKLEGRGRSKRTWWKYMQEKCEYFKHDKDRFLTE